MLTGNFYRQIREMIAEHRFAALRNLEIPGFEKFNWVRDVFEALHVKEQPGVPALVWTNGKSSQTFSFKELSEICNRFINFLAHHHLPKQGVIFSQMPLWPENWITILASVKGGYRLVPAATMLSVQDIDYRFGKLLPDMVIADAENAEKIDEAELISGKPVALKIIVQGKRKGWIPFEKLYDFPEQADAADTRAEDPLFLFFTSGTTGMPKIVTHTHSSYPVGHLTTAAWIGLRKGDIHYNISQPGWAKFAWSSFFAPWNVGATVFAFNQAGRFNAAEQLAMLEKYKITTFCAPPTALRLLIQENLALYHFSLRECVAAGEPLNPEIIDAWKKGTGLMIRDGYGQTESTCLAANMPGDKIKFGSMGKPTFLYDIIIADDEGKVLPANEEGNITVKTEGRLFNGLFSGYFGEPSRKRDVFRHGLYYTGDKAYRDGDGYIWFVGRDDDVIKTSDYRVGPFEVESILLEHESVLESAVVGSPHAIRGFVIKAFIVLTPDMKPNEQTAKALFSFARKNLAPYKSPRIIEFVKDLPKTISGKIRRVELRAEEARKRLLQQPGEFEYFL